MTVSLEKFTRNAMDQKMNNNTFTAKEDTLTKPEDESSLSDGGETFLNKSLNSSHFSFENVRFTPKVIEFVDAFEGKQFAVKITIQNVGRNPVHVKIGEPNSFIFQLKKPSRRSKFLAAGACITKMITYTYHNVDLVQKSQIPVQINGHFVDYPIVVKRAVPDIEIHPQKLDFKIINIGASAKTMVLTIFNKGGKRTKFKVDVGKNVLDLVVSPMRGTIKPKNQVTILVEMMGFNEGEYYHELWIKTNELPIRVPVLVKVVRPRLEIVFPNGTEDFTLITFKPTFNGAQRVQSFILKNCSTDTTLFSTLAEVNGELQVLKNARSSTDAFNMFMITAEEGRLEPFEKRIITVVFRPRALSTKKCWQHKQNGKKGSRWEHIVFLRINRVHRIERRELFKKDDQGHKLGVMKGAGVPLQSLSALSAVENAKTNSTYELSEQEEESTGRRSNFFTESSLPEEKVLRLCLYGKAVEPDILIQPTSFEFGDISLGQTKSKVLRVTNNTTIPVKCRICKTVNVKSTPGEIWLKGETAHEFVVSITPTCAGVFKAKMKIQVLAQSEVVLDSDKLLETVAMYTVTLIYTAKDVFIIPQPKIGLGITPVLTDDAGFQKDLVTFKDARKYPPAAMLGLKQGFQTAWMKEEVDLLNNVENAIIALPNDRPRLFYTWPKNKICRTIFSGFFRYSPPEDLAYTLSPEKREGKAKHNRIWADYINFLRELRKTNYPNPEELKRCLEYDVSCKEHYNMGQIKFPPNLEPAVQLSTLLRKCLKKREDFPEYTFVPLSPMFLSNVTVQPKFMNFDKVAVSTIAQKAVSIRNMNTFPISIKFVSGKSAVSVMEQDTITIQPSVTKYIQVLFQSKDLGRYFGFLNYVINGSHEFKITISAFVTSKTLFLGESTVTVEFGIYDPKEAFQPRSLFMPIENLLQAPIKYRWNVSMESAFNVNITEGEIPPRSTLIAEFLFNMCPRKSFYSDMTLVSESGVTEIVKLVHPSKKVSVNFLSSRMDMHDIPLNLPTKVKAVIQNAGYHDVTFEVLDATPLPGVTVEPKEGLIRARSFFPLEIKAQIPVIMKFSFYVVLMVHFVNKISIKVTGNVVLPAIRMKPAEVVMRKICAQSMDTFAVCVENVGSTPAEVVVDFKSCPEYRIADNNDKLYLSPKQSSKFLIHFEPTDVARYMFYLPVTVNKILGPPEMQEPETEYVHFYIGKFESLYEHQAEVFDSRSSGLKIPCVCLNSTVSQSLLGISLLKVNFKPENKFSSKFQPQEIVFSNDFNSDVTFCIRNDDLGESNDSPFNLVPVVPDSVEKRLKSVKAQLGQGQKLVMNATFEPKKPGLYSVDVPVFVRGYSNGLVYNYISLKGELKSPRINAEVSEIHFPPLPLDVGCDVTILVCAENYRAPDTINCVVYDPREDVGETATQCLKTTWLTEPNVSHCRKASSFQLQVSFRSSLPISIKNYIILFDSAGIYSTVFVTGIADNSAVTTHAFLSTRSIKYRIIRDKPPLSWKDEEILPFPPNKSDIKISDKNAKEKKTGSRITVGFPAENSEPNITNNACSLQIDRGPRLVVQESKSISRSTQHGLVNLSRHYVDCRTSSPTVLFSTKSKLMNSFMSKSESISGSRTLLNSPVAKRPDLTNDVTYPNFPVHDGIYKKHFEETLNYVERWMFEVIMQCDQYFCIPESFQILREHKKPSKTAKQGKLTETRVEKNFLDFLQEILGKDYKFPKKFTLTCGNDSTNSLESKALKSRSMFAEILRFLETSGCLLPHVKPEYLMDYENYVLCANDLRNVETFSWKNVELEKINSMRVLQDVSLKNKSEKDGGNLQQSSSVFSSRDSWKKSLLEGFVPTSEIEIDKVQEERNPDSLELSLYKQKFESLKDLVIGRQFTHKVEILDKTNFKLRSTQAWLDVVIQIFRVFILNNIALKNTIPHVSVIGMSDKISVQTVTQSRNLNKKHNGCQSFPYDDSLSSNVFTVQERILMDWLNRHYQTQLKVLWGCKTKSDSLISSKLINNFDKDLSDSLALIAVTASHCPYIVPHYFKDIFSKPDTLNKTYHNAGKLIQAWRTLEIGLTVETSDIVQPNPMFMVILVTQLYEVLPSLHPHSLICFSNPLNTEITRVIQLKNDSQDRIFYKAKFFGEYEGFFSLGTSSLFELKPEKTTDVSVVFTARKIKKASATLLLSGYCVSPNFAKHMVFYLEGEPSELPESDKYSFSAPLYKVVCTAVPVRPPFPDATTYEVWYTTKAPVYSELIGNNVVIKPWSKIWNRKVSRRLFLNKSEVTVDEGQEAALGVTVACLTEQTRFFWLLFRSKICDFIVLVEIKPKQGETQLSSTCYFSESWSPSATCLCSDGKQLPKLNANSNNCPFLTELKIPTRNENLWNALWSMFLKTLHPHEKSFWNEHFEMDIGICLILWLLSPEEEEEVIDEFIQILSTRVTYKLTVEPPNNAHVIIPPKIEVLDVRKKSEISLPVHVSSSVQSSVLLKLTMTSENGKEIRNLEIQLGPLQDVTKAPTPP